MNIINIDVDKYILRVFWLISIIVTIGVLNKYAPAWPVLPFISYGLTSVFIALGTYLTAILGNITYLTAKNKGIDTVLEESGNMEKFLHALGEPVQWGHYSLASTLGYFIATFYGYAPLIGALQFLSISTTLTAAYAIMRNLHMVRMFSTATLRQSVMNNHLKEAFLHDLFSHIQQMEEKDEESNKDSDSTVH